MTALSDPIAAAGNRILDTWSPTAVILVMVVGSVIAGVFLAAPALRTDVKAERIEAKAERAEERVLFAAATERIVAKLELNTEAIKASGDKAAQSIADIRSDVARMQETLARMDESAQEGLRQKQSLLRGESLMPVKMQ